MRAKRRHEHFAKKKKRGDRRRHQHFAHKKASQTGAELVCERETHEPHTQEEEQNALQTSTLAKTIHKKLIKNKNREPHSQEEEKNAVQT
jgi:hypothetical protein